MGSMCQYSLKVEILSMQHISRQRKIHILMRWIHRTMLLMRKGILIGGLLFQGDMVKNICYMVRSWISKRRKNDFLLRVYILWTCHVLTGRR